MSAIGVLHKFLRTKAGGVDYSGTKDKRAVTAQLCTVYRRKPSDFNRLNASNCAPFIRAGDFKYVSSPLALGDNAG
jgi:tRNA(Glu) U13 pseudouridine synthase TruD